MFTVILILALIGLSYESDVHRDVLVALEKIVDFVKDADDPHPALISVPFDYHSRCDLSIELYNFKELECVFGTTPLKWLIHENKHSLEFDQVMQSGFDFMDYVAEQKNLNNDIMSHKMCRIPVNLTILNEYKARLTKNRGRCGHGGHTKVCMSTLASLKMHMWQELDVSLHTMAVISEILFNSALVDRHLTLLMTCVLGLQRIWPS